MKWFLAASCVLMALYFFGVAPDVMKHSGSNWVKPNFHQESSVPAHH